ncbi:MAG: putative MFS-type transporter YhjX [Paracidovorax wautersii]|uniref:Putative MFS-type transporter YhjX n=1 Tax=Paracidovorax wautersii TaxID=1177982 RepID=A0A7V8JR12_9BURK|nr:MAG: putative MFS-type transporter YhjX [Paracidovorax wautersii]
MNTPSQVQSPVPWRIAIGALLALIVGNGPVMQFTFGVLIIPLSQAFGTDRGTVSTALMVGLVTTGLATPWIGRLMDRHGVRRIGIVCILAFALLMAACGWLAQSVTLLILLYGICGVFAAGQTPLPYSKAIAVAFDRRRGLALGVATAGVGIGTMLMPMVASALLSQFGWRGTYVGLGLITVLLALPALTILVAPRATAGGRPQVLGNPAGSPVLQGWSARQARSSSVFWVMAGSFFLVALAVSGVIAHIVPLLVDRGVSPGSAAVAISVAGLSLLVGRIFAGWMLGRYPAPYVAILFFCLPLIGVALLLVDGSAHLGLAAAVLVGLGLGAEVDLIAFMQSRYFGQRAFGEIYGYFFAIFMLGSGLGPFLMGQAYRLTGGYAPFLMASLVGLLVACGLMAVLRKRSELMSPPSVKTGQQEKVPGRYA